MTLEYCLDFRKKHWFNILQISPTVLEFLTSELQMSPGYTQERDFFFNFLLEDNCFILLWVLGYPLP